MSTDIEARLAAIEARQSQPAAAAPTPTPAPAASAAPAVDPGLAATIAAAIAAHQASQQQPAPRAAAAAPSAPTGHGLPMTHGIVDPFQLTHSQISALGAKGVAGLLNKIAEYGAEAAGLPQRKTPGKGR